MVIILAGQLRGNEETWETLNAFKHINNASLLIGSYSPEDWEKFPLTNSIVQTQYIPNLLTNCYHQDMYRHRHQWSNLFSTWDHFKDTINEGELVVKLRNDFILYDDLNLDFSLVEEGTIYVPEKEFHEATPFDTEIVCNDQIVVGKKKTMDRYFQFPKNVLMPTPNTMSVEELLREYLRQQKLILKTFKWTYTK